MIIEIKNRFTGVVIFSHDCDENTILKTVCAAIANGASLDGANLVGANLVGASLYGANLVGANLVGASLYGASLYGANLVGANLYGASLYGASLVGASLDGANLVGASLYGASLVGANLDGEILTKPPITISNMRWPVLITPKYMRIGCQRHTHQDWESFDEATIRGMAQDAPDFWRKNGAALLATCAAHRE